MSEDLRAARHLANLRDCPDCEQGKHTNCTGDTWCDEHDNYAPCPCAKRTHPESVWPLDCLDFENTTTAKEPTE